MIVAHSDDELLWGWKDLLNGEKWTVICIFQQYNFPGANFEREKRLQSFNNCSKIFNFKPIIFNFEDNPYNLNINYEVQEQIKKRILEYIPKKFDKIVTHNPYGEYGHYHHKIVSKIVSKIVLNKDKLFYFSFDKNNSKDFNENYNKCFNSYFFKSLDDKTVIGHKNLSKITKTIKCLEYKYFPDLIKNNYPYSFLKCQLLTNNNFLI